MDDDKLEALAELTGRTLADLKRLSHQEQVDILHQVAAARRNQAAHIWQVQEAAEEAEQHVYRGGLIH
ncbi:MAG: hypothetical protein WAZ18_00635 [Alphaproteobacteria bacterium]